MSKLETIYEPHPVSPERKADLRARGFRIIDAAFAPEGYAHPDADAKSEKPARKGKADAAAKAAE